MVTQLANDWDCSPLELCTVICSALAVSSSLCLSEQEYQRQSHPDVFPPSSAIRSLALQLKVMRPFPTYCWGTPFLLYLIQSRLIASNNLHFSLIKHLPSTSLDRGIEHLQSFGPFRLRHHMRSSFDNRKHDARIELPEAWVLIIGEERFAW